YQAISGGGDETVRYTVATVEKDILIVSVSGSGQVTVLDQVDIKPEVSGDIVGIYINKDQEVKTGQLLAELGTKNAQQAIYDAEIVLDDAKEELKDLLSPPDVQSLRQAEVASAQAERDFNEAKESYENIEKILDDTERQAEVASAQAERDFNEAKESYENIEIDTESSLITAYEDGYNTVAAVFLKLSSYMKNLKDVLGTEQSLKKYITAYELILGEDSLFIQRLLNDYDQSNDLFNKNYVFFITVFQDDDRDTVNELINDTLETTRAIFQTLDSARHMFDAIIVRDYQHLNTASHIDKMKPKIDSDASAVSSNISSLQAIKDTIDDTIKNTPDKIEDAEWALQSAQEKFDEKKLALEELIAGVDPKDIKSQENIVTQKEDALFDAKKKLASCSIRAPFDGVIAEKNDKIKKGDSVSSSTVLATLITKQKIAQISLNEIDAANIKVDQKATITFDALPEVTIVGRVIEIDTMGQVSQGIVSYGIKIIFDTDVEQVKPGMSVTVDIITEAKQDVLILPSSAIKFQEGAYYVELVDANKQFANTPGTVLPTQPKRQSVEIGLSNDFSTEVVSGLKEGDIVVVSTINPSAVQTTQTKTTQTQGFQIPGINTGGMNTGQMKNFR
ncbi:efflux RND transporter periplasmic adaptor subunit, partial [Patescibacteria group bacterium]|nr:efflux RND transporter periplasmic adaptor subunit [Patescibacteria group bacterium]